MSKKDETPFKEYQTDFKSETGLDYSSSYVLYLEYVKYRIMNSQNKNLATIITCLEDISEELRSLTPSRQVKK